MKQNLEQFEQKNGQFQPTVSGTNQLEFWTYVAACNEGKKVQCMNTIFFSTLIFSQEKV